MSEWSDWISNESTPWVANQYILAEMLVPLDKCLKVEIYGHWGGLLGYPS